METLEHGKYLKKFALIFSKHNMVKTLTIQFSSKMDLIWFLVQLLLEKHLYWKWLIMSHIQSFTPEVQEQLQYYVYRLIDPRDGQTFYIGKGRGNRIFAHVAGALNGYWEENEDELSAKIQQIREIHQAGLSVIHIIQRFGLTENEAFEVEAALIDCFPGLTNLQKGHGSERGVNNAEVLQQELSYDVFQDRDDMNYVLIKVKKEVVDSNDGNLYETVRKAWKLNLKKASRFKTVLGVVNGIVRGVYTVERWQSSDVENGRIEFVGEDASDEIRTYFLSKRIPEQYRKKGMASPVLYHE